MFEVQDVLVLDFGDKHIGLNVAVFQKMSDCDLVLPVSFRGHPSSFQLQAEAFQELFNESLEGDALSGVSRLNEELDCVHREWFAGLDAFCFKTKKARFNAFEIVLQFIRQLGTHNPFELFRVRSSWQ